MILEDSDPQSISCGAEELLRPSFYLGDSARLFGYSNHTCLRTFIVYWLDVVVKRLGADIYHNPRNYGIASSRCLHGPMELSGHR
jgi:hypothetical protein